jgi:hypothetical protein
MPPLHTRRGLFSTRQGQWESSPRSSSGSGNQTNPFAGDIIAVNRALVVNGCTPAGVTYETAAFDPFPISGTDSTS